MRRNRLRSFGHERGAPRDARDGYVMWTPTENVRPARTTMGDQRGLWMTRFRAVIRSVPTGFDAAGACSPLLISWRHTRKYSERFIGITRAWGRPQKIEMLAAEVSPHPPFDVRVARRRTESERREAPSGRARSTTEARARRTRSFGDDERCDTRDGRGCTQRTAHGEGPRILHQATKAGSADGLRKRRTRRSRHFGGACSKK